MKIGFIGTGHITKSVINGILKSKLKISKIVVSKRNIKISSSLKKKNKKLSRELLRIRGSFFTN